MGRSAKRLLKHERTKTRAALVGTLSEVGSSANSATTALVQSLDAAQSDDTRTKIVKALIAVDAKTDVTIDAVARALQAAHSGTLKQVIATAISNTGPEAAPASVALENVLLEENDAVTHNAIVDALGHIGRRPSKHWRQHLGELTMRVLTNPSLKR